MNTNRTGPADRNLQPPDSVWSRVRFHVACLVVVLIALTAFATSCGNDDGNRATATIVTSPSTPSAFEATATPSGTAPLVWLAGTKTGDSAADLLVEAVRSGEPARVQALLKSVPVPCANERRYDGPNVIPPCAREAAAGSPVQAFPASSCDIGTWHPSTYPLTENLLGRKLALFAVFRQNAVRIAPPGLPSGGLVVLMRTTVAELGDGGLAFEMDAGTVVRITSPCGPFPSALLAGVNGNDFVLAPPGGLRSLTPTPTPAPRLTANNVTNRYIQLAISGAYPVLADRFQFYPEPCEVNPQGVGSKPRCPDGVAAGAMVQTARITACERAYLLTKADIEKLLRPVFAFPHELFAVFRTDGALYRDFVPTGATAIVISDPRRDAGRVLYLDSDGRLVGMRLGCGETPLQMTSSIAAEAFLVPPPAR